MAVQCRGREDDAVIVEGSFVAGDIIASVALNAPAQFAVAAGVSWTQNLVLGKPDAPVALEAAILSFIFASVIGSGGSTNRNWENLNPETRWIKNFAIGMLFGTLLTLSLKGFEGLNPTTLAGFISLVHVTTYAMGNSFSKMCIILKSALRTELRKNTVTETRNIPGTSIAISFNRANLENGFGYLWQSFLPKTLDVTGYKVPMPGLGDVPIAKPLLWIMGFYCWWRDRKYFKENGNLDAVHAYDDYMKMFFSPKRWANIWVKTCRQMLFAPGRTGKMSAPANPPGTG